MSRLEKFLLISGENAPAHQKALGVFSLTPVSPYPCLPHALIPSDHVHQRAEGEESVLV